MKLTAKTLASMQKLSDADLRTLIRTATEEETKRRDARDPKKIKEAAERDRINKELTRFYRNGG